MKKFSHIVVNFIIPILLVIFSFVIYKNVYLEPRNWYDHYLYLSKSIINGSLTVDNIPEFYQDVNTYDSHKYLPFPPVPALTIIPFILIDKNITQQLISIIIASINLGLLYILLKKYTSFKNAFIISIFIAFGTVYFWVSIVGTSWYFAHIVAFFYLTLSLISASRDGKLAAFLTGLLFTMSALSRMTLIFGGLYFVVNYWKRNKQLLLFLAGAFIFIPIIFVYNYGRFNNVLETGYTKIYEDYTKGGYGYSIQRVWQPDSEHFRYLDIRSIPYHLYTLFIMPPEIKDLNIFKSTPSPYGMGILFISPLLLIIFSKSNKTITETKAWLGLVPVALATFLHYAQGWVQFGYRFLVDFLPFVALILAVKFKLTKLNILFLIISLIVCYWGTNQAIKLGW